jgi:hypothetical protein
VAKEINARDMVMATDLGPAHPAEKSSAQFVQARSASQHQFAKLP